MQLQGGRARCPYRAVRPLFKIFIGIITDFPRLITDRFLFRCTDYFFKLITDYWPTDY